jgi:hypothetical protein
MAARSDAESATVGPKALRMAIAQDVSLKSGGPNAPSWPILLFSGALVIAGLFTLLPGRIMHNVVFGP